MQALLRGLGTIAALALALPFLSPAHANSVTISVAIWGSSVIETRALNDAIAAFESKFPDIKVDLITDTDHAAQMSARFASHNPPDAFYLDADLARDWATQGLLENLNPYITEDKFSLAAFNANYLAPFRQGAVIYGLPKDANPLVLEGNRKLMRKAGITHLPRTVAEFDRDARRLARKHIVPMCVDADINRLAAWFPTFNGAVAFGTTSMLTSTGTRAALTWQLTNFRKGYFRTPTALSAGWTGEAFGKGKCAFTMEGAWLDPFLKRSYPTVYQSMVKGPLPYKTKPSSVAITAAWAMGKESQNKPQAWQFISYMTGKDGMTVWTSHGVAMPSRNDVPIPSGFSINGAVAKSSTTRTLPNFIGWSKVEDAFNNTAKAQVQNVRFDVARAVRAIVGASNRAWPTT